MIYNDADIIEQSLAQAHRTRGADVEWVHVLVDAHWPLNRHKVIEAMDRLRKNYGCIVIDPGENLGLHGNFNYALNNLNIPDNALIVGFDPDCWPVTSGWDKAMCDVFIADDKIVWLSLWHPHATRELIDENKSYPETIIAGHRVVQVSKPVMNSVCGFRSGWLKMINGITEPSKYYGGLECAMWDSVKAHGKWVFLPEFKEDLHFQDVINPMYREWKWEHAHKGYPYDFVQFLKERGVDCAL